jgi:gliding motility-associated-like protein
MKKFYILFFFLLCCINLIYSQDDDCIVDAGVELIPGPTPDPLFTGFSTYPAETTVQMCYTVDEYNTPGTQNWMHGIVPLFGPGWDLTTLQPVGQPETQFWAGGEWIWVGDVVAGITGELISGPGWFFDAGSGGGTLDGDPTDNWGDGNNGPWTFCWEITTQSCPPAFNEANLIVEILNFADSETGSWNNSAALNQCLDDPSYYIQGVQLDCPTCDESGLTIIHPTCANVDETGGVAVVTPEGIGPWNYIWFNLDSGEIIEENTNVTLPVTVSGLESAEYLIQVEDLGFPGGCSSPVYFEILPPEEIMVELDVTNASCIDSNDGVITVSSIMNSNCIDDNLIAEDINGDGIINNDDFSCPSTSEEVCGCDFVTYFNACQATNWYGITAYDTGSCSGFPTDYDISWSSSNSFNSPSWNGEITSLLPGEYSVLIASNNNASPVFGCDFQTTVVVGSPEQFNYNYNIIDVSCFIDDNNDSINDIIDGAISINLTGGTEPYTTSIGLLTGEIIATEIGSSISFSNLGVGDYFFTPFDAFGCLVEEQEVFFTISEPEPIILENIIFSDYGGFGVACNNDDSGFINIDINGGTPPYQYNWSNSTGTLVNNTQNLSNANAGIYSVQVVDQNNCELLINDLVLSEPNVVDIIATEIVPVSCSGATDGAITVDISGGVSPYSFSWFFDDIFLSNNPNISDIPTGDYTVIVTDNNNCEYQEIFSVTTPNPILINETITNISCFEFNDGSIDLSLSGGTPPYIVEWSTGSFNENISNLSPGVYDVIVTDNEGCFETATFQITEPTLLIASVSSFDVLCFGENTGSITPIISGGTPPYTESWSGGADPNNLFAGVYSLTITDANSCIVTVDDIIINQPDLELALTANIIDVFPCNGDQTGSIEPIASGGTFPYQFSTTPGVFLNQLGSGLYTVSVVDSNGCVVEEDFFVDEPNPVSAIVNSVDATCFGLSDGQASAVPSGGTGPYTVLWSDLFGVSVDPNNLSAGTYLLSVEDSYGCLFSEYVPISQPSISDMVIDIDSQISCLEPFNINVSGVSSGNWSGSGPGNIEFSSPLNLQTEVIVSEFGTYEIVFTNDCGEEISTTAQMLSIAPLAEAVPVVVYCDFETSLVASSFSSQGFWSLIESPDNTQVTIDNINSFETDVYMTPIDPSQECCYGDYLFSFTSCGKEDYAQFSIQKEAPEFGVSTYQDCLLDATIFIENPISFADALMDPGTWEWSNAGVNQGNVDIYYATPHEISFGVSDYGLYEFRYLICDTFYQHFVGFSCPLELPNVFTPNSDLNNDFFLESQLIPLIHSQINFTVYNRFGQIVHSQNNYGFDSHLWDGTTNTFENKKLNDGVYYYILELFNNANMRKERYSGYVHLFKEDR